ncbi:MAG: hypothetical protein JSS14_22255 [Proteobacteria bacterium]|nr:hypothetical protein [Pseudomonadota bacterium]
MSKFDLLTPKEKSIATSQGWQLVRVFDSGKNFLAVLPLAFEMPFPTAQSAHRAVTHRAMNGDVVCIKALSAIAADAVGPVIKTKSPKKAKA